MVKRGLVLAATLLGGGCIVVDPSYLGPHTGSGDVGTTSTRSSGSDVVPTDGPSATDPATPLSTSDGTESTSDSTSTTGCGDPARGWWDPGWSYRHRLSFDRSEQDEALLDFTVLIVLRQGEFDYSKAAPDGADLRLVDDDGSSALPYHIERWDPAGDSTLWVRVPTIDAGATDDHIWLYYGNPRAPAARDLAGSWDDAYVGVWHLEESSGAHVDSTIGIGCLWAGGGAGSQDAPGQVAGAVDFDGIEDGIDCGNDQILDSEFHTITAWVRLDLLGDNHQSIVNVESTNNPFRGIGLYVRRMDGAIGKWLGNNYHYARMPENMVQADTWSFLAIRGRRGNPDGYLEVSQDGGPWETIRSGNTNNLELQPGTALLLGKWDGPGANVSTQGTIDEVRISNVARSDDWVRAHYLSSSEQFVSDAGEQPLCP